MQRNIFGVLLLVVSILVVGCGGGSSSSTSKEAKNDSKSDGWQGVWYAVNKDEKSGVVTNIMKLDIKDQKTAHLTNWDLKGNTFSSANGKRTLILWQSTDLDLAVSVSGNTLEFTVPDIKEMGTVLECNYDGSKGKLHAKENDISFSKDEVSVDDIKEKNIKSYQEFAAKQGITVEIERDMTDREYMEYVKENSF